MISCLIFKCLPYSTEYLLFFIIPQQIFAIYIFLGSVKKLIYGRNRTIVTPFPPDQWYVELPRTCTTSLWRWTSDYDPSVAVTGSSTKLRRSGLIGATIILGDLFNIYTLSVPLADMMHSQYTITSHLQQLTLNFDAGSFSRLSKGNWTAKFLAWPIFQCRCSCTSTYPTNIISLTDACARSYLSALLDLLPPNEKQNSWLTQT